MKIEELNVEYDKLQKNIWKLFYKIGLLDEKIYQEIISKKPQEWDEDFADIVYSNVEKHKYFITNLGKCTQTDARSTA